MSDDDTTPTYPMAIPGLEHDHPAQFRDGMHVAEHDRPGATASLASLPTQQLISQAKQLRQISYDWRTDPAYGPIRELLTEDYHDLKANPEPADWERRCIADIEALYPKLKVQSPTDTERLRALRKWLAENHSLSFSDADLDGLVKTEQREPIPCGNPETQ
jgi:hypothetical protein